jgi:hypothetical protein
MGPVQHAHSNHHLETSGYPHPIVDTLSTKSPTKVPREVKRMPARLPVTWHCALTGVAETPSTKFHQFTPPNLFNASCTGTSHGSTLDLLPSK